MGRLLNRLSGWGNATAYFVVLEEINTKTLPETARLWLVSLAGMVVQPAADIPLQITSPNTSSERRISPSWTISQLKARLETITGVPVVSQRLVYRGSGIDSAISDQTIEALDESNAVLSDWNLAAYAEILVQDTRPAALQQAANLTDPSLSNVPKYEMPQSTYETLSSTVLAYKRANKLGRFAPEAIEASALSQSRSSQEQEAEADLVREKGIAVGARCRLLPASDARRGKVAYAGVVELDDIPPPANKVGRIWVGVELDEPTGKNNGSVSSGGRRYFRCAEKCGVFVRPERIEVGDFPVLGLQDDDLDSDMEEI